MENLREQRLRIIGAAKGLVEELVVVLKQIRAELTTSTGERMKIVEVEIMCERFDHPGAGISWIERCKYGRARVMVNSDLRIAAQRGRKTVDVRIGSLCHCR
jgi:hypothetical protein